MRDVLLYGEFARRFGRHHRLDVESPAEAIRALSVNLPGFEEMVLGHFPGFHVMVGDSPVAEADDLRSTFGRGDTIRIVPAIAGGKSGWASVLLGAVLIAAAVFMPASIGAIGVFGTSTVASLAGSMGLTLALGGAAQLLSPVPKAPTNGGSDGAKSYGFSGPVNVTSQGGPIPVVYGRMIVGSAVASMVISLQRAAV